MPNKIEELIYYHYDFTEEILSPKLSRRPLINRFSLRPVLIDSDIENIFATKK